MMKVIYICSPTHQYQEPQEIHNVCDSRQLVGRGPTLDAHVSVQGGATPN